jgi:hypothetical protein
MATHPIGALLVVVGAAASTTREIAVAAPVPLLLVARMFRFSV